MTDREHAAIVDQRIIIAWIFASVVMLSGVIGYMIGGVTHQHAAPLPVPAPVVCLCQVPGEIISTGER